MTGLWTALVPVRFGDKCKTRLAGRLTGAERSALVHGMARHVVAVLGRCEKIGSIALLSPVRPDWWSGDWILDEGRGVNAELAASRYATSGPLCIIHADLPLIHESDVIALLGRAERLGASLATDRGGTGSNAIALADDRPFAFQFGPGSREKHEALLPPRAILNRPGLAIDIDEPKDLLLLVDTPIGYPLYHAYHPQTARPVDQSGE